MNFIQSTFLFGGLAVAIPVLVHLLSRWQVQEVELGTMRFLREVIQDGAQRRKIRRWLLLLTRVAVVGILALLFARPYLPETIRRDGDRLRLILIDRSASMGMPGKNGRLIDDALTRAEGFASELGADATVQWVWFDRSIEPIEPSSKRVNAPSQLSSDTDYLSALAWARDRVAGSPDSVADVVLISDMQQTGLASESIEVSTLDFPADIPLRIVDVGRPAASNLAIQSVTARSKRLAPGKDVDISVTLFNFGSLPVEEVPLSAVATDGTRSVRLKKSINIMGGQAQEVSFEFGKLASSTWKVTVSADVEDDLGSDNRRVTAFDVTRPATVFVVDRGLERDGILTDGFYLDAALKQSGDRSSLTGTDQDEGPSSLKGMFASSSISSNDELTDALSPDAQSLVIVADSGAVTPSMVQSLEQFVSNGGKLLVFAGPGDSHAGSGNAVWRESPLAPGVLGNPQRSGAMPFRITWIDHRSSMLEPFADPQHGDLSRLEFRQVLPIEPEAETHLLATFDRTVPAMTSHAVGDGKVVWFLSSADNRWSSWTNSPLYLPLVHQMAADLLNMTGEGQIRFRRVGDPRSIAATDEDGTHRITTVSVTGQMSKRPVEAVFDRPGFEQENSGPLYVVNAASKESDPTRITLPQFSEHFNVKLVGDQTQAFSETVSGEHKNELWPWLGAAAFVLVAGEFFLANRTTA